MSTIDLLNYYKEKLDQGRKLTDREYKEYDGIRYHIKKSDNKLFTN